MFAVQHALKSSEPLQLQLALMIFVPFRISSCFLYVVSVKY